MDTDLGMECRLDVKESVDREMREGEGTREGARKANRNRNEFGEGER